MAQESGGGWQQRALLGFGLVGLVVLAGLWNKAPALYAQAKDPGAAVATTRAGILTAIAGFVAFTGVMLNVAETRRATELTRVRDEQARARDRLTHERELAAQLADRYTAAVTQLGSDTLDVRLGGLYALKRIAVDSPADHRTVVDVLSAFVREHTIPGRPGTLRRQRDRPAPADLPVAGGEPTSPAGLDTDLQAALTVLGRLPVRDGILHADLTGKTNLSNPLLARGATLTDADLVEATLIRTVLRRADLTRAELIGADLAGADLRRRWG